MAQEDVKELQNEGSQLTSELTCADGCSYRWQSQLLWAGPRGKETCFWRHHFSSLASILINVKVFVITRTSKQYVKTRTQHWGRHVCFLLLKEQSAVWTNMKSPEEEVVLCGDGRCHSAKYCTYTFLHVQSQKVVDFKLVSCTQVSSSNTMEIRGFKEALPTMEGNGVKVSTLSTDRHPHIVKEMRVSNPEKCHEFDPWHVAKGVSKKLSAAAKRRECEGRGDRIPSITNHLWWSAQTCGGDAEVLKEMMMIHHVTNRHDWPGNRHYHRCAHEPLDETSQRSKLWLQPGSEGHRALVKTVKDERLLKDLAHLTKCIHTTSLEVCSSTEMLQKVSH